MGKSITILNDHLSVIGGGAVHSLEIINILKSEFDVRVVTEKSIDGQIFEKLSFDVDDVDFHEVDSIRNVEVGDIFLNISHWRLARIKADKKYAIVFFPNKLQYVEGYKLIGNSKFTLTHLKKKFPRHKGKISFIYPPVRTDMFRYNPVLKENVILHCSRVLRPSPNCDKGHKKMLNAFKNTDLGVNWELHFVGPVENEKYLRELESLANGYNIYFHRSVDQDKLIEMYEKASFYWHFSGSNYPEAYSAQEHFGMATVEAMSAGAIPISRGTGGQVEIIDDEKNGFLVSSVSELSKTTKDLSLRSNNLRNIRIEALSRSKKFKYTQTAPRLLAML